MLILNYVTLGKLLTGTKQACIINKKSATCTMHFSGRSLTNLVWESVISCFNYFSCNSGIKLQSNILITPFGYVQMMDYVLLSLNGFAMLSVDNCINQYMYQVLRIVKNICLCPSASINFYFCLWWYNLVRKGYLFPHPRAVDKLLNGWWTTSRSRIPL